MKSKYFIITISLLVANIMFAQDTTKTKDKPFNYNSDNYDLIDVVNNVMGKERKSPTAGEIYETHWSIFPAIAINPALCRSLC